jgi:acetaldehyde dehydrogenase (acetylating)
MVAVAVGRVATLVAQELWNLVMAEQTAAAAALTAAAAVRQMDKMLLLDLVLSEQSESFGPATRANSHRPTQAMFKE